MKVCMKIGFIFPLFTFDWILDSKKDGHNRSNINGKNTKQSIFLNYLN